MFLVPGAVAAWITIILDVTGWTRNIILWHHTSQHPTACSVVCSGGALFLVYSGLRAFWYINAVHCELSGTSMLPTASCFLVYQCCSSELNTGSESGQKWARRIATRKFQRTSPNLFLSTRQPPISQYLQLWVTSDPQHRRPHQFHMKRYQRSHLRDSKPQHSSFSSTWYQSTSILPFNCWGLHFPLDWSGTLKYGAPIIELFYPSYSWPTTNSLTALRPHQYIECNVSVSFNLASCTRDSRPKDNPSWQQSWVW